MPQRSGCALSPRTASSVLHPDHGLGRVTHDVIVTLNLMPVLPPGLQTQDKHLRVSRGSGVCSAEAQRMMDVAA